MPLESLFLQISGGHKVTSVGHCFQRQISGGRHPRLKNAFRQIHFQLQHLNDSSKWENYDTTNTTLDHELRNETNHQTCRKSLNPLCNQNKNSKWAKNSIWTSEVCYPPFLCQIWTSSELPVKSYLSESNFGTLCLTWCLLERSSPSHPPIKRELCIWFCLKVTPHHYCALVQSCKY